MTAFRRAFILRDLDGRAVVGVEVSFVGAFVLPNTAGYDADAMLGRVCERGEVDLTHWVPADLP